MDRLVATTMEPILSTQSETLTATDAHAAAVAKYRKAEQNHEAAMAVLATAQTAKSELLRSAASGAAVGASDVRACEEAIKDGEAAALLTQAIMDATKREVDEAEIAVLQHGVQCLRADWDNAVLAVLRHAREADGAVAKARAEMAGLHDALNDALEAFRRAQGQDASLVEMASRNAILAALPPSRRPKATNGMKFPEFPTMTVHACIDVWGRVKPHPETIESLVLNRFAESLHLLRGRASASAAQGA